MIFYPNKKSKPKRKQIHVKIQILSLPYLKEIKGV